MTEPIKKVLINFVFQASLLGYALLAVHLAGEEGFGRIAMVLSLGVIISVFSNLGLDQMIIKTGGTDRPELLGVAVLLSLGLCSILVVLGLIFDANLVAGALLGAGLSTLNFVAASLQVYERFNLALIIRTVFAYSAIYLLLIGSIVLWDRDGALVLASIVFLAFAFSILFVAFGRRLSVEGLSWNYVSASVKAGLYMCVFSSAFLLSQQADIVIMSYFRSDAETGVYALAVRFAFLALLGHTASTAILPRMFARKFNSSENIDVSGAIREWLKIGLTVFVGVVFLTLILLFGDVVPELANKDAFLALAFLFIGVGFNVASGLCGFAMTMSGNYRTAAFVSVCSAMLNILLNLLLVPYFGGPGAAFATMVSMVSMYSVLAIQAQKKARLQTSVLTLFRREESI